MQIDSDRIRVEREGGAWNATYGTLSVSYRSMDNLGFHLARITADDARYMAAQAFAWELDEMTAHERLELAAALCSSV